ncbi:MAG: pyruvate kinase, partial [Thermoprotei archaeon]
VTELAEDLDAKLVIFSMRGNTARLVSLLRPRVNFYVGSPSTETLRRISILWGVNPLLVEASSYEEGVSRTYDQLKREGLLKLGELVVLTYGLRSDEQVVRIKRVEP